MLSNEYQIATIVETMLGRHKTVMTCYLGLRLNSREYAELGGYGLDNFVKDTNQNYTSKRMGSSYGMQFVCEILDTLDCETWEKLVGTKCRVVIVGGKASTIGHLTEDKWFEPRTFKNFCRVCNQL